MPIYEYRCGSCGVEKEHLQKVSDAPVAACPACGSNVYTKLISAAGFQLKGSGWYATDFKNGTKPKSKPDAEAPAAKKNETVTATASTADTASPACATD
ncbi:putative regulatory protein, FmdB family [Nitrosospira sp. Nl5]|uniref:FmdB family zinc ribbon protein n=1 Tax=Nitrosospira sp. Nl5 TaxID=200120 RepID=UPI000880BE09|nr:zinc ribbon domain-containing protein [Nitrosospira sp. Nl5]SCY38790.1 putative regulatory protein, FmdB family [Nitrosospira sp. Nl5]